MKDRWGKKLFQAAAATTMLILGGLVLFLLREGLPALWKTPYEGLTYAVHPQNPCTRLSPEAVQALLRGETTWAALGGPETPVVPVHMANLDRYVPAHASASLLRGVLDSLATLPGALFALPPSLLPAHTKPISVPWKGWKALFTSVRWSPTYEPIPSVGVWPLLIGSLWVSAIGLLVVVPLGLAMAVYVVEFLPKKLYYAIKMLWEVLAGLPSVVVGFWGLMVLVPWIQKLFHLEDGETALTAGLLLGWMTLPLMASLVEEALQAIPPLLIESSYGLGATQWQTILRLKLPYIMPSIFTATLLAAGRILGETMVVLIVSGNAPLLSWNPLMPVRTLPATLAAELGEAPIDSYHYHVLFFLGIILFLLTLSLNALAYAIRPRTHTA